MEIIVRKMKRLLGLFISIIVSTGMGWSAMMAAQASDVSEQWRLTDMSQTRLISARTGTGDNPELLLGLQIKLDKGWKTYWRSPGDAGLPPRFSWSESDNIESVEILWPKPRAFDSYGFLTWGYQQEVVFPIRVTLKDPQRGLNTKLQAFYGICAEVCVPVNQVFSIDIPAGPVRASAEASIIDQFQARVPSPLAGNTAVEYMSFYSIADNKLIVEIKSRDGFLKPSLILEGAEGDFFDVTAVELSSDNKVAKFSVTASLVDDKAPLKGQKITGTILDNSLAVEGHVTVE